jgi:hypothetical protein
MHANVQVRFGGGRLEKDCTLVQYLAGRLPYIPMAVDDQHFALLERQHVLFLEAVTPHGIDAVGERFPQRRWFVLGPHRCLAGEKKYGAK